MKLIGQTNALAVYSEAHDLMFVGSIWFTQAIWHRIFRFMRNGCFLNQAKNKAVLPCVTVVAMPPLATKNSKREAANVSLALLKSKEKLIADGKS